MASIQIDKRTLDKVKNRFGVYNQLPKKDKETFAENLAKVVTPYLLELIENAFREYASKHTGCTKELEQKEWMQFNKILKKYL